MPLAFVTMAWPLVRPRAAERIDEDLLTRVR
jgi:hypothetical protein